MRLFTWGAVFGYLVPQGCGEYCGCHAWRHGREYRVKSPIVENGSYPTLSFPTVEDFWSWFFRAYGTSGSRTMFDDFCITGCWNWVLAFDERGWFEELFERLQAATKFGLRPAASFDDAPARLLDGLLVISREMELAQAEKAKKDANRNNQRIQNKVQ